MGPAVVEDGANRKVMAAAFLQGGYKLFQETILTNENKQTNQPTNPASRTDQHAVCVPFVDFSSFE